MAALFGMGGWELVLIAGVVLLLFGPKRLPQLAKSLGKSAKALRDGIDGSTEEEQEAASEADTKTKTKAKAKATVEDEEE